MKLDFDMIAGVDINFILIGPLLQNILFKKCQSCQQYYTFYFNSEEYEVIGSLILDAADIDRILIRISHKFWRYIKGLKDWP
jgi:hypothetical protein